MDLIYDLIDMGVNGMIVDYPDRLRRVLEKRGMDVPSLTPVVAVPFSRD